MGDGGAEGSSAIGDGGQAAISLKPDIDAMHVCILGILQLEGSYVGDLLYFIWQPKPFPYFMGIGKEGAAGLMPKI